MAAEPNNIPPPKQQLEEYERLKKEASIKAGEDAYIISVKWFDKWKEYVKKYSEDSTPCGQIDNTCLLKDGKFDYKNNHESFDYEIFPKQIWDLFHSWYGGGPAIAVEVIEYHEKPVAIVNHIKFKVYYQKKEMEIETNKYEKVLDLRLKILKLFDLPEDTESRLIDYYNKHNYGTIKDKQHIAETKLYEGQEILLDTKDENGKWKHEKKTTTYSTSYTNYYTSPAPAPGLVGLSNLGNTCFFNSGVQCLLHTNPLKALFLHGDWERDLNTTNPIGMKGKLAQTFIKLFNDVWSPNASKVIAPRDLKHVIGRYAPQFSGYGQQDSQELITFMLDGIHEDLNRCKVKPQTETVDGDGTNDEEVAVKSWENYKKRNDSMIVDTFYGQLRSSLNCPNCHATTVVFDPYNVLNLPISKPHCIQLNVRYIPYDFKEKHLQLTIAIPTNPTIDDISKAVSNKIGKEVNVVIGTKGYTNSFTWRIKQSEYSTPKYYVFEVPTKDKLYIPSYVQMKVQSKYAYEYARDESVAGPFLVPIDFADLDKENVEEEIEKSAKERLSYVWESPGDIEVTEEIDKLMKSIKLPKKEEYEEEGEGKELIAKIEKTYSYGYTKDKKLDADKHFKYMSTKIVKIKLTDSAVTPEKGFSLINLIQNYEPESSMYSSKSKEADAEQITLNKCFEYFTTEETLDEQNQWFCPKCRQFVCARKVMDIWTAPKILIVSLKRFISAGRSTSKLGTYVDYPDLLDISKYVKGPHENHPSMKYRLYAVSEHMGTMYGGHYIAHAILSQEDHLHDDDKWYCFDDSSVAAASASDAHSARGYVLFYERIDQ
ncbi:Clan CA, family C19, ubiquitin hydrolase-like cysteine peptidase [Histomonas meleagridis]|uniref:Clan CA, family C19, ubiquitin hydrolase-like cysteine peptidase n=1 Tax=Histomonas meleagridis TaxID=135588 RepID=UPI003559F850|nr:Clan CA, family C19, ubiquitin hydrolase-like cysteine peptidase [Histomonas meleagridis]KAH0807125.1 Clan CA, family C19, ubiquitin hydrolase-like cysteine peptidase [Histomonas meleagridis]